MAEPSQARDPFRPPTSTLGSAGPPYAFGWEHGFGWVSEAWRMFVRDPLIWVAIIVAFFVLPMLLNVVPVLGSLAASFLNIVLLAGILLGCARSAASGGMRFASLFAAFQRPEFGQLLLLGLLSLLASVAVVIATVICGIVFVGAETLSNITGSFDGVSAVNTAQLPRFALGIFATTAVAIALAFCFGAAFWLAPARVILGGRQAIDAIADSFTACLRSWRALTMFGIAMMGLAILAAFPFFLGFLAWFPVSIAATYVIHRDLFGDDGVAALNGPPRPPGPRQ